MHTNSQASGAT